MLNYLSKGDITNSNKSTINKSCTFLETGDKYKQQSLATCYDCFTNITEGACFNCIKACHSGHNIGPISVGKFFCDCGADKKCDMVTKIPTNINNDTQSKYFYGSCNILASKLASKLESVSAYSPLSITFILSLLHFTAVKNTEKQFTELLSVKNSLGALQTAAKLFNTNTIKLVNAILVNKKMQIEPNYLSLIETLAWVTNENFDDRRSVVAKANNFISQNTNHVIPDMLNEDMIDSDTVMILINTIYFIGKWKFPFDEGRTHKEMFNNNITHEIRNRIFYFVISVKILHKQKIPKPLLFMIIDFLF